MVGRYRLCLALIGRLDELTVAAETMIRRADDVRETVAPAFGC